MTTADTPAAAVSRSHAWSLHDLDGEWRVIAASDDVLRSGVGLETDDEDWPTITVPSHWQSNPNFAASDGPLLYRRTFTSEKPVAGERRFVVLDGVFYQADIWLDGAYLGDPEGYFVPHAYDVTALSQLDTEHALAIAVTCSPQRDKRSKRNITGVFQHWDCISPSFNPGGLWRGVRIERTGPVRIDAWNVLCRDANESRAHLRLHARLDSDIERPVKIVTLVDGEKVDEQERTLASGANEIDWTFDLDDPQLWWPWSMGPQPLVDVTMRVIVDQIVSHDRTLRTGLREIAMQDWVFSVNGERLFVKGTNLAPTRATLGEASPVDLRRDIELAREAGLDLVRVHGHVSRPELYDAADELGMLVWQDFPLQWGYARQIRRQAVRQAEEAVNVLGHHPSIALWCAHNEPFTLSVGDGDTFDIKKLALPFLAGQQLPSWNKSILDRWVKRAFERSDETRPVIAHSGVLPHLPQLDGTDSHLYFGWYHGKERDLPEFAARLPRLVRFVSEFGAQAVPDAADFIDASNWPNLDWDFLRREHGLQKELFDLHVPPRAFATFDEWRLATQVYQAEVLKHHIETLRRLKYSPTGGFCFFAFNDAMPMVSWSVLDHERNPKLGFNAVADACRPVIVVADRLPVSMEPGQRTSIDIHAVSDLHRALEDAQVMAVLTTTAAGGESRQWIWEGDIAADECCRIGAIDVIAPYAEGQITLDLTLQCGDVVATNRYTSDVRTR